MRFRSLNPQSTASNYCIFGGEGRGVSESVSLTPAVGRGKTRGISRTAIGPRTAGRDGPGYGRSPSHRSSAVAPARYRRAPKLPFQWSRSPSRFPTAHAYTAVARLSPMPRLYPLGPLAPLFAFDSPATS